MWSNLPPLQRPFASASHSRTHSAHASPTPLSFAHSLALLQPQATHAAAPVAVSSLAPSEPSPSPSPPPPPPPRHQRTHSHGSLSSGVSAVGHLHSSFALPSHAAASTTFYLPASPVPATAASRSDSAEVHRQASRDHSTVAKTGESEPVALTELVRRLSWDDAMMPAEPGGSRLQLQGAPGHQRQRSGGGGSGSGGEFSPLPLRSQPPSPVLAAIEAQLANAQQQSQGRSPQHGGPHARQLLLFGGMDSSVASLSPTAAAADASVVEPRSLLLHRKIASCPSGLSDMRAGGGTSPAAMAMGGGHAHPQPQHHSSHVAAHMQLPAHLQHPHSHSLQGSPSPSPPHTPSSPIHGHGGGGHSLQFPGGAAFAASTISTASSSGKLSHSSSAGGSHHHYHPYARSATVPAEQFTQAVQAHHQQQLSQAAMAQHRPTVISPASRFLSRKLGPTIPAALMQHQQQMSQVAVVASPPVVAAQLHMPPPLSLCTLSAQADYGVMSAAAAGVSAIASPPSSPHPYAVGAGGVRTPTGSSRGVIHTHAHTHAHTSPSGPAPFAAAGGGSEYGGSGGGGPSERPSSFPAANSSLLGGSGGLSSFSTSCASSPQLRPGSEVSMRMHMPTPDFVATFDSRDAWGRLSNHSSSPLKHRSLPGTPSLRANAGSVPPTPRAVKQRSRRASEQDKQLLESAAVLLDFSQLSIPSHSLPLMAPLPVNPSFSEQVLSNSFLGSGSFGDVYRIECTSARPFAAQYQAQAAAQQAAMQAPAAAAAAAHSSGGGGGFLASPPLSTLDMPPPPQPATLSNSSSVSSASSVASIASSSVAAAAGTAVESRPSSYALALKATKLPFTSLQERQKYLQRYLHLFHFVQILRAGILAQLESSTSGATVASLCAAAHIDPTSFFPRHLVACHVVWQDQCRIYLLMDLCERGDLTTYWSQPILPLAGTGLEDVTDASPSADAGVGVGASCESTPEAARQRRAVTNSDDDDDGDSNNDLDADREYEEELRRFKAEHGGDGGLGGLGGATAPSYLSPLKTLAYTTPSSARPVAPLCEADLWRLLEEICSALALMHAHNFLHLDIKVRSHARKAFVCPRYSRRSPAVLAALSPSSLLLSFHLFAVCCTIPA